MASIEALPEADWLGFCRRASQAARDALAAYPTPAERARETGRGEGGDMALVIDRAAEDAILSELEQLGVPVTAISEERGELEIGGGGETLVVIDPVDGSLNAKRRLPFAAVSIAVASGPRMADVQLGFVAELEDTRDWWAVRGQGVFRDGEPLTPLEPGPLELLGLETARPQALAQATGQIAAVEASRVRAMGSVALSLCMVAAGQLDAMVSLLPIRSVDAAAGQLLVEEAGGAAAFPADDRLALEMRSQVAAARDEALLRRVLNEFSGQ